MSARHDLRVNERDWTQPIVAAPITQGDITRAALGQHPQLIKRLSALCRSTARGRLAQANDCRIESLQRDQRCEAAEFEATASVLERIAC